MKNVFKKYVTIWAISLALFNVICFVTPKEFAGYDKYGGAFWVGYIFITLAYIGQLICANYALKASSLKKLFYNVPIISISYTGLIIMLIVGSLAMAIPDVPNWVGIIVCVIVVAFTAMAVIKARAAADIVEEIDSKVKVKTEFIKDLTLKAEGLLNKAKDENEKALLKKLYEKVRYSDPMSSAELTEIEGKISNSFNALNSAMTKDDIDSLINLLDERNRKCKLLK